MLGEPRDVAPDHPTAVRRNLTVMFCDVVGSTRLSRDRDVESYFSLLRTFYDMCAEAVERHGGRIVQRAGDGIYVWFGHPSPGPDDVPNAVRAGLELLHSVRRAAGERDLPLTVRVAVHTGMVLVTPVEHEPVPLAFGHAPNLAAKLQSAARPGCLVISDDVHRLVDDVFDVRTEVARLPDGTELTLHEVLGERAAPAGPRVHRRAPLLGRDAELDTVRQAWSRARDGAGEVLSVTGPSGVGKTRLAAALLDEAAAEGQTLHSVVDLDRRRPYGVFRQLLAQAAALPEDPPPGTGTALLARHLVEELGMAEHVVVAFGAVLGLRQPDAAATLQVDPAALAVLTATELAGWVGRLAARRPLLLLVDDAPDVDASSAAVLAGLAAAPPKGLLLLRTCRAEPGRDPAAGGPSLALRPLPAAAAEQLARAIAPLPEDELRRVLDEAAGVPPYLEELTRSAARHDGGPVPSGVGQRLQARFLAPGVDRRVTAALAVAGRPVAAADLAAVTELPVGDVEAALAQLVAADLAERLASGRHRFRHALVAGTALDLVLHDERARLHGRFADLLAGRPSAAAAALAGHHLDRAGRPVEAYRAYLEAADAAHAAGATEEALRRYGRALELTARVEDEGVRDALEVRVRVRRGTAAFSARGFAADESIEDFTRCAALCERLGPRTELLAAVTGVYTYCLLSGDLAGAERAALRLRAWVDRSNVGYRPANELAFGVHAFMTGDYASAAVRLRTASREMAASPPGQEMLRPWLLPFDPVVAADLHLAPVLWITGAAQEALEAVDRALVRAAGLPFPVGPYSAAYAKSYFAWMYRLGGHHEASLRSADEVRQLGVRHGFAFWQSTGEIHHALARFETEGWPGAVEVVAGNAAVWEFLRARVFLPAVLTASADVRARLGDPAGAAEGLAAAAAVEEETGARFFAAERLRLAAGLAEPLRRNALLREAWETAGRQGAHLFALRAATDLARAEPGPAATARLTEALDRLGGEPGYPEVNEARALIGAR